MNEFTSTLGFVMAIAIGVMALGIFFRVMASFGNKEKEAPMVKLKGFFKGAESVNIVMGGGRRLDRVKVIGVTDANSVKGGFPYELHNMLVVEKENGKRLMIKASLIKMIEESEETESVSIDDGSRRD